MGWWDDFTDWLTGDDFDAPVTSVEDGDLESAPTESDVREAVETLRPFFLEGYRRQEAYDRHGGISLQHVGSLELISTGGGYAKASGQKDFRSLDGFYRMSETLGFHMPAAIPDSVAADYPNGEQRQASWAGTTEADDAEIDSTAQSITDSAMRLVNSAYDDLLNQCDITAIREALPLLTDIGTKVELIHDNHYERECREILELWNEWDGSDAEAAVEEFGGRIRGALDSHKTGIGILMYAASAEATAQAASLFAAHNYVAQAWEMIREKLNSSTPSEQAVSKYVGAVVVNRIPFLSDGVATADFIVEVASNGEVQSPVSSTISKLADKLTGKDVPDGESCYEIVTALEGNLADCVDILKEARRTYLDNALTDVAEEWNNKWSNGIVGDLIPGYLDA
ncbi:hypothetical protein [Glycomyces tenuis]|uniref:hypothetical protein n=1 Tax=Glycomyces tenuis TaxID=58116 RepID=UPI0003F7AEA8|nr:hypothetical protein [Glycomyces tenuis]